MFWLNCDGNSKEDLSGYAARVKSAVRGMALLFVLVVARLNYKMVRRRSATLHYKANLVVSQPGELSDE